MYCWKQLRAFAAAQDYTGYFQWNISELTNPPEGGSTTETDDSTIVMDKNGKEIREVTMTNNVDLLLKEFADDCEAPEDLDVNNLNVKYDWRSYRSVLGLEGLDEYTRDKNKGGIQLGKNRSDFESEQKYNNYINDIAQYIGYVSDENGTASQKFLDEYANQEGVIYWNAVQLYNAHAISQVNAEQEKNKMARGIKRADYFI